MASVLSHVGAGATVARVYYFTVGHTARHTALLALGWLRHIFATPHELLHCNT